MLQSCSECCNGLVLPMLDISAVYNKGTILYIHDVPFTVCTHCNHHEFVEHLTEIKSLAKNLHKQYGSISFKYDVIEMEGAVDDHGEGSTKLMLGALVSKGPHGAIFFINEPR